MSVERQQQIGAAYIPSHIMCDQTLTITQKVLWGRIQGLSTKQGYCYASNEWIGNQIGLKGGTVSNLISRLVKGGYLKRKIIRDELGAITERWLYPVCKQVDEGVPTQKLIGVPTQKLIPINAEIDTPIHVEVEDSVRGISVREESKKEPPSDKPKMDKESLNLLTEHYASIREARPRGKAWLPIQQGFKQMVMDEGYEVVQVIGCMDRLKLLGWTWTINTVRKWIADYAAGTMPENNSTGLKPDGRGETYKRDAGDYADAFKKVVS